MGSLGAHVAAFLLLFTWGIRHLVCSFSSYLKSPPQYTAKIWYFLGWKRKNLDLYIISISLPIAALWEVFMPFTLKGNSSYHIYFLEQAAVLFAFWVVAVVVLISKNTETLPLGGELIFSFAGIAFVLEWMVLRQGTFGLEEKCYSLLAVLSLICAASCFLLACHPLAFWAEVTLSGGILFQGTWVLQTGLFLFSSFSMPEGCHRLSELPSYGDSAVQCDLEQQKIRAMALVDLAFVCHAVAILISSVVLYGSVAYSNGCRRNGNYAPMTADLESLSDNIQMQPMPKFDIE